MRRARERQFDPAEPPWLHCVSRCVRRAYLCGDGCEHRKDWLERRLRIQSRCFSVLVGAYAVMSNHLHVVLRPLPRATAEWSPERIVRAWWCLRNDCDPETSSAEVVEPPARLLERLVADRDFIHRWRQRLGSVSWFMKELKEPLSRQANREEDCTGAFWEGRFSSVPLLDDAAIVACMAYVDLNPIRAQLARTIAESVHTSVRLRIAGCSARRSAADDITAGEPGPSRGPVDADDGWLAPIARITAGQAGDPGWSLQSYLALVDSTGRALRGDKRGAIPAQLPDILSRLGNGTGRALHADAWLQAMGRPRSLAGTALGSLASLGREARRRGRRWLQRRCPLLTGCAYAGA